MKCYRWRLHLLQHSPVPTLGKINANMRLLINMASLQQISHFRPPPPRKKKTVRPTPRSGSGFQRMPFWGGMLWLGQKCRKLLVSAGGIQDHLDMLRYCIDLGELGDCCPGHTTTATLAVRKLVSKIMARNKASTQLWWLQWVLWSFSTVAPEIKATRGICKEAWEHILHISTWLESVL
jgi:hypothetical protein